MFSVRPQCMLSCLLTASCLPMWEWEAEADTGLHLMGASECCKQEWPGCHYTVFLKDVSRHSETAGSEGDRKLCFWIATLEAFWISPAARKAGATKCWVESNQCVPSMRTKAYYSSNPTLSPIHLCQWEVMKSSGFPCCDSKSHLSWRMQCDPYPDTACQHMITRAL